MARVELDKLTKVYAGGVRAVNAIDLSIADREFIVLVGPSGCGKSTTLRMVAGLEEITDGTIRIGERIVNDVPPKSRDIAMVFQNYALYPHMSVYKNMAFGLKLRKTPKKEIRQRVTDAARILEIEHLLDRKPKALSGGQRQRVAVGRAIVREPAAFLFDEPLSNLDAKLRVTTRAELKRLHQRLRTTTLYVTHDQEEAMTLGDRIVVMKDGLIQQAGTPLDTYNRPANRFVAGFIGMPPMNFFDGIIQMVDGRMTFHEARLSGPAPGQRPKIAPRTTPAAQNPPPQTAPLEATQLTLSPDGFTLCVPPVWTTALENRVGRHVVLGIRPEHFHLRTTAASPGASIEVEVNVIEPLGNDMDVYMKTRLHDHVVGRVEADPGLGAGTRMTIHVDPRKIHFFDPGQTGMNLSLKTPSPSAPADGSSASSSSESVHAIA